MWLELGQVFAEEQSLKLTVCITSAHCRSLLIKKKSRTVSERRIHAIFLRTVCPEHPPLPTHLAACNLPYERC